MWPQACYTKIYNPKFQQHTAGLLKTAKLININQCLWLSQNNLEFYGVENPHALFSVRSGGLNLQTQGQYHPHIIVCDNCDKRECISPAEIPAISWGWILCLTTTQKQSPRFQKQFWTWPSHYWKVFDGRTHETSCWLCPGIFSFCLGKI